TIRARLQPGEPATNTLVLATIAVAQGLLLRRSELRKGYIGGDAVSGTECHEHAAFVCRARAAPGFDRPLCQGFEGIRNEQIPMEAKSAAKRLTDLTCTQGAVEGEQVWHRITVGDMTIRTMQMLAEFLLLPIRQVHNDHTLPEMKRLFE